MGRASAIKNNAGIANKQYKNIERGGGISAPPENGDARGLDGG